MTWLAAREGGVLDGFGGARSGAGLDANQALHATGRAAPFNGGLDAARIHNQFTTPC